MICKNFESCIIENKGKNGLICKTCREENVNSYVCCTEKGRTYNLHNDEKYRVVNFLLDGGVYFQEHSINKCDRLYVINDPNNPTIILIELKGKNIRHGLEQIYDTISRHKEMFRNYRKAFRIVCSGAPKIGNDPTVIRLKKEIYSTYGNMPKIRENRMDEDYSSLFNDRNI